MFLKRNKKYKNMNTEQSQKDTKDSPMADNNTTQTEIEDVTAGFTEDGPVDPEMIDDASQEFAQELEAAQAALEKEKKEYLFLMADFDNFRKRVQKEKAELIKNGAEKAMLGLLPIVDDFERGLEAIKDSTDADAVKEGMVLIYNKLIKYLESNGVKAIESNGAEFDAEIHEAIAAIPAPAPEMKGKVIDTTSKGYTIYDKVLRHPKVVVGE